MQVCMVNWLDTSQSLSNSCTMHGFLRCMGIVPECGIMEFRGRSPRNSIIPREGYNPYILENHSTADLYYDATNQTLGSVFPTKHYALLCSWGVLSYTLECMSFLEYMGFVLVVFPLKCGFIITKMYISFCKLM